MLPFEDLMLPKNQIFSKKFDLNNRSENKGTFPLSETKAYG